MLRGRAHKDEQQSGKDELPAQEKSRRQITPPGRALADQLVKLIAADHHAVDGKGEEMREIKRQGNRARRRKAPPPRPFAQRDPNRDGPQHQAEADYDADKAPEEQLVVDEQEDDVRPDRAASGDDAMQNMGAGADDEERGDEAHAAGQLDRHDFHQRQHDHIHGQIGLAADQRHVIAAEQGRVLASARICMRAR